MVFEAQNMLKIKWGGGLYWKVAQFKGGQKCSRGTLSGFTTVDQENDGWHH